MQNGTDIVKIFFTLDENIHIFLLFFHIIFVSFVVFIPAWHYFEYPFMLLLFVKLLEVFQNGIPWTVTLRNSFTLVISCTLMLQVSLIKRSTFDGCHPSVKSLVYLVSSSDHPFRSIHPSFGAKRLHFWLKKFCL